MFPAEDDKEIHSCLTQNRMDNVCIDTLFPQWIYRQLSASNKIFMCPHSAIVDDFMGTRLFYSWKTFFFHHNWSASGSVRYSHHDLVHKVREEATWWHRHPNWQCFFVTKRKAIKYLMKEGPHISIHLGIASIFWYICENWVLLLEINAHRTSCPFTQLQMGNPMQ